MPGPLAYPSYHNYTQPADYVRCSTTTRTNFVFDADRVGTATRIYFAYQGGPILEKFARADATLTGISTNYPDVGPPFSPGSPPDGAWQDAGTANPWAVASQVAYPTTLSGNPGSWAHTLATLDVKRTGDLDVSCQVKATTGRAGICFRSNGYTHSNVLYLDIATGRAKLSMDANNLDPGTTLVTGTTPIVADTYYTLRVTIVGNLYTAYVNGVSQGTATDASNSTLTRAGMWSNTVTARFAAPFTVAKNSNPVATAYSVRNYDGDIVASGSVTDDHIDIEDSALLFRGHGPYGWYRVYLIGPDHGDNQWGTAYGDCTFLRVRTDSNFPANVGNQVLRVGETETDEYAAAVMRPTMTRMSVSSLTAGTAASNNALQLAAATYLDANWTALAHSLRPRTLVGAFSDLYTTAGTDPSAIAPTVNYLKGVIKAWEPRNEPFYGGAAPGEGYITNEFDVFRNAVKSADTTAKIFGPGPVTFNGADAPGGYLNFIDSFLVACMSRGGTAYLDALTVHAYNCFNGDMAMGRKALVALKAVVANRAYTGPIYQTEQGYEWLSHGWQRPRLATRWTGLQWMLCELYGIPLENNYYWYDTAHGFEAIPFWWLDPKQGPGPQVLPLRIMSAEIGNRTLTAQFDFGTYGNTLYAGGTWTGADGSKTVGLMAASMGVTNPALTVTGASSLTCVDTWGNTFTLTVTGGTTTFPISELPQWIRCPAGVTVTPATLSLTTNLALTATASASGAATNVDRLNDGLIQNNYYADGGDYTAASAPCTDQSGTFPQTITLDFGGPVTANRIIVYSFPPWQNGGTITDFDVDTFDGTSWTTRLNHPLPTSKTFMFTSVGRCIYESFWDEKHIFDAVFTAATITKVRVVVRGASYGDTEHPTLTNDIYSVTRTPYVIVPEIQVFNSVVTAPSPGVPRLRNPAMGGVTG